MQFILFCGPLCERHMGDMVNTFHRGTEMGQDDNHSLQE